MSESRAETEPRADSAHRGREWDFATEYTSAYRLLWVIAAGVTGDRAEAADVVHDAAVQALSRLETFEPGSDFAAWMSQIVRYVAMNRNRSGRRRQALSLDDQVPQTDGPLQERMFPSPHTILADGGRLPEDQPYFDDELISALRSLPQAARTCVLLRTVAELPYSEIARLLEIPEGTAMSHVHRSRRLLRSQLRGRMAALPSSKGRPT